MNLMARNKRDERMRSEGRAEVLASGIKAIAVEQKYREGDSQAVWDSFEKSKKILGKLQPTVSHLNELLKQARAEVLAACIHALRTHASSLRDWPTDGSCPPGEKATLGILLVGLDEAVRILQKLQPAAKDLEKLLREAHNEGHECENSVIKIDEDGRVEDCQYKVELLRKKARASEGK